MRLRVVWRVLMWSTLGTTLAAGAAIHGAVSDSNGKPLEGAQVELVEPFKAGNPVTATTITDNVGHCEFNNVGPGRYQLFASKVTEGYGDPLASFFAAGRPEAPDITVTDEGATFDINIDVGAPGGFLKGSIVDSTSHAPIPKARIKMVIIDDKDRFISFGPDENGSFETPVPAMPIDISLSAPGYQSQEMKISVASKGHKQLFFRMKGE